MLGVIYYYVPPNLSKFSNSVPHANVELYVLTYLPMTWLSKLLIKMTKLGRSRKIL